MPVTVENLSFANAKTVLNAGLDAIENGSAAFDLASVTQADSSGVAVMLAWQRAAKVKGITLVFMNVPDNILSLAALYGVTDLLGLA